MNYKSNVNTVLYSYWLRFETLYFLAYKYKMSRNSRYPNFPRNFSRKINSMQVQSSS